MRDDAPVDPLPRGLAARFELLDRLGRGSFGAVWRARDRRTGAEVALKLVHPRGDRARDLREVEASRRLDHPHVLPSLDGGVEDGVIWLTSPVAEGDLGAWIQEGGRRRADALGALREAARGVAALHRAGLVHRDLKPGNLLRLEGRCVVADLGLSRTGGDATCTRTGEVLGTPTYMAPEQARGEPAGPAADLWALGILACEVLTGAPPWPELPLNELVSRVAAGELKVPPAALDLLEEDGRQALRAALDPRPEARPADAAAWAARLQLVAARPGATVVAPSPRALPDAAAGAPPPQPGAAPRPTLPRPTPRDAQHPDPGAGPPLASRTRTWSGLALAAAAATVAATWIGTRDPEVPARPRPSPRPTRAPGLAPAPTRAPSEAEAQAWGRLVQAAEAASAGLSRTPEGRLTITREDRLAGSPPIRFLCAPEAEQRWIDLVDAAGSWARVAGSQRSVRAVHLALFRPMQVAERLYGLHRHTRSVERLSGGLALLHETGRLHDHLRSQVQALAADLGEASREASPALRGLELGLAALGRDLVSARRALAAMDAAGDFAAGDPCQPESDAWVRARLLWEMLDNLPETDPEACALAARNLAAVAARLARPGGARDGSPEAARLRQRVVAGLVASARHLYLRCQPRPRALPEALIRLVQAVQLGSPSARAAWAPRGRALLDALEEAGRGQPLDQDERAALAGLEAWLGRR